MMIHLTLSSWMPLREHRNAGWLSSQSMGQKSSSNLILEQRWRLFRRRPFTSFSWEHWLRLRKFYVDRIAHLCMWTAHLYPGSQGDDQQTAGLLGEVYPEQPPQVACNQGIAWAAERGQSWWGKGTDVYHHESISDRNYHLSTATSHLLEKGRCGVTHHCMVVTVQQLVGLLLRILDCAWVIFSIMVPFYGHLTLL